VTTRRRADTPQLRALVLQLRVVADLLDKHGDRTVGFSRLLASRGWPASTGGGGSRSSDTTSSTERAALGPHPWAGIDERYLGQLAELWKLGVAVQATMSSVLAHASDEDPVPAGTGHCRRCERFCRPTGDRPQDRIRAGYCPACYRRWLRLGRPDRTTYERTPDDAA